jgi:hypothetical protein
VIAIASVILFAFHLLMSTWWDCVFLCTFENPFFSPACDETREPIDAFSTEQASAETGKPFTGGLWN